jgi:hypothetical protein
MKKIIFTFAIIYIFSTMQVLAVWPTGTAVVHAEVMAPLDKKDVTIEAWIERNPESLLPGPSKLQAGGGKEYRYTIKAEVVSGPHKGLVCWDLYNFAAKKSFKVSLFLINDNKACEVRTAQMPEESEE